MTKECRVLFDALSNKCKYKTAFSNTIKLQKYYQHIHFNNRIFSCVKAHQYIPTEFKYIRIKCDIPIFGKI